MFVLDKNPGVSISHTSEVCAATYVDNIGIGGSCEVAVNRVLNNISQEFHNLGLNTHEHCSASTTAEFIGLEIDHGRISVKKSRIWKIKGALDCLLKVSVGAPLDPS